LYGVVLFLKNLINDVQSGHGRLKLIGRKMHKKTPFEAGLSYSF
jgi:hypothetical protein